MTYFQEILLLFLGVIGIFVIAFEHRARRKLQEEELRFRQKQHEEAVEERKERREWLISETFRLKEVSAFLAENIAAELRNNISWAADALERAKLKSRSQTLFGERLGHFRDEKEHIAEHFIPLLLKRCKAYVESGRKVYLLVDSGTTLYTFFERIGRATVRLYENRELWIDKMVLVTNNLPGVDTLIEAGRINPNNRYSRLAINCELLPGVPLPIYSAVTGGQTEEALMRLKAIAGSDAVFIGLVTGNWIRLRRSTPACPIPLARGAGHLEFKQIMINNSDEVYVVTPLGKLFVNVPPEEVNVGLEYSESHPDPDRQPYREVNISDEKAKFVKIVSTSRSRGRILYDLSTRVRAILDADHFVRDQFPCAQAENVPHILFPFDRLPDDFYLQEEIEFPHSNTRREEFLTKFFFVSFPETRNASRAKDNYRQ
jgi:hypothetical protein